MRDLPTDPPDDNGCPTCNDDGTVPCEHCNHGEATCPECDGDGEHVNEAGGRPCRACDGEGLVTCEHCDGADFVACTDCPTCVGCGELLRLGGHSARCWEIP